MHDCSDQKYVSPKDMMAMLVLRLAFERLCYIRCNSFIRYDYMHVLLAGSFLMLVLLIASCVYKCDYKCMCYERVSVVTIAVACTYAEAARKLSDRM